MAVATAIASKAMATTLMQMPIVSRRCDTEAAASVRGSTVSEAVMPPVHHLIST